MTKHKLNMDGDPLDRWADFDSGGDPISIAALKRLDLAGMPEGVQIGVLDNYFPDVTVWRDGGSIVCEIREHLYTKYWEHKFSAYAFAFVKAMEMAVRRLEYEATRCPARSETMKTYTSSQVGSCGSLMLVLEVLVLALVQRVPGVPVLTDRIDGDRPVHVAVDRA